MAREATTSAVATLDPAATRRHRDSAPRGLAPARGAAAIPGDPGLWRRDSAFGAHLGAWAAPRWLAWLAPLALVALALALSLPRLTTPDTYVFDELYYAYTAGKYVAGEEGYSTAILPQDDPVLEWTHPPLAKLLIAGGILLAGDNPLGWRIVSVLFGAAGVVIVYVLALALSGSRAVAVAAAGLLLLDGLYLVESRTGMSNLFLLVFANAALLSLTRVLAAAPGRMGAPLLATGLSLGLAIATKWSAVALAGLIGLIVCGRIATLWWRARQGGPDAASRADLRAAAGWALVALIVAPVAVYLASYAHYFLTGHGWDDFVQLHRDMLAYHRGLGTVHDDSSPWWQWPLVARGVWYYVDSAQGRVAAVFGIGNPLLYWPMVVAVAWVAIDWWGRRPIAWVVLAAGFFGQWLPWALSPRGTFIYHFLPAAPLGCVALAVILTGAWRDGGIRRAAAVVYVVAVVATFAFFYPIFTAIPLDPQQIDLRMWLPSWR